MYAWNVPAGAERAPKILTTVDISFLYFEVAGGFLPTYLDRGVHDDVWFGVVFSFGLSLILPALFHSEGTYRPVRFTI